MNILLDFGHSGSQSGACHFGVKEKFLNEVVGSLIYMKASKYKDLNIELTRTEDIDLPLKDRLPKANHDCLISIHHNSYKDKKANGFSIHCNEQGEGLADKINHSVLNRIDLRRRGVKLNKRLYLLRNTEKPSIIIECGFMSNKKELIKMCHPSFQCAVAEGVLEGINNFKKTICLC